MKKNKILFYIITLVFVAVTIGMTVKKSSDTPAPETVQQVRRFTLEAKDTLLKREYVAAIKAIRNIEIRSHLRGFLEEIYVDEGRFVRKGQLLFRLNDQELKADLAKANAAVEIAEAEVLTAALEEERITVLVAKKVVSESELMLAKAKVKAARAKVKELRATVEHIQIRLSYTQVRAPYDGVIDRIPMKVGSLIDEGALLTTLSDVSRMYAYFEVSENEYLAISKAVHSQDNPEGAPVELVLSDGSLYDQRGKVETMTGEFAASTGSIAFRAVFSNADRLLKHGATGKIVVSKKQDNVLLIPQKAVFEVQDKNFVYVIGNDSIARIRSFIPKTRVGDYYIVSEGLRAGESIAAEGIQYLRDGMVVNPL